MSGGQFNNSAYSFTNEIDLEEEYQNVCPRNSTVSTTMYQTIQTTDNQLSPMVAVDSKFNHFIKTFNLPPIIFESFMSLVTAALVWLTVYTIVGDENLPGGVVFVVVFLEFGGRITGKAGQIQVKCIVQKNFKILSRIFGRAVPVASYGWNARIRNCNKECSLH